MLADHLLAAGIMLVQPCDLRAGLTLSCYFAGFILANGPPSFRKNSCRQYLMFHAMMPSMKKRNRVLPPTLLVSFGAMSIFGKLMINVKPHADSDQLLPRNNLVTELDQKVNEKLHHANQESPTGVEVFNFITDFGGGVWIRNLAILVALGLVIVPCGQVIFLEKRIDAPACGLLLSILWILVLLLGEFLNIQLKDYVMRTRPPYHEAAHAVGY